MKHKFYSVRFQLILIFLGCASAAGILLLTIFWFLISASSNKAFAVFFMTHLALFLIPIFLTVLTVFISSFLFLTRKRMRYMEKIHQAMLRISDGDLDTAVPVEGNDELAELAATLNQMSAQLKLYREEEKKWEKSKNDMIANLSHDLRSPLTSVIGYVDLINRRKYHSPEELQHYSDIARIKCNDLKTLAESLFEYTKINSAGFQPEIRSLNLAELLEQVLAGFIPVLDENGMKYELDFEAKNVPIMGDPVLLARLFNNLVSNAVNYGKEGKYLRIFLEKEEKSIVAGVANYGDSIPEEELAMLFERFYKADRARTDYAGGSGLGLAIVKSITEMHHGSVSALSENGCNTFLIRLPAVSPIESHNPEEDRQKADNDQKRNYQSGN